MHFVFSLVCTLRCTLCYVTHSFWTSMSRRLWLAKRFYKKFFICFTIEHWKTHFLVRFKNFDFLETAWKSWSSVAKFFQSIMHTITPFLLHEPAVIMSYEPWQTVYFSLHNNEVKNAILVLFTLTHCRTHEPRWESDISDWKSGTTLYPIGTTLANFLCHTMYKEIVDLDLLVTPKF